VFALHQSPRYDRYGLLGATVVNIGRTPGLPRGARACDRLARLLRNIAREKPRFDVLHAFFAGEPAALAALAGRAFNIPVITTALGGEFVCLPQIQYGGFLTRASRLQVRFALANSSIVTAASRHAVSLSPHRGTKWVPMGVDCSVFAPPRDRTPGPPWRLLHVASLNRVKDQPTLLRAMRLLVERGFDVHLQIVGEDTLNGATQRLAVALGITDRVQFSGFVANAELASIYRDAHLYLHSSLSEGMPVSALEAAASGLPLVGTAVGLFCELAPDASIAVPPADPLALADGVALALSDPGLRDRIAASALRFARQYDADWTAAAFEECYCDATADPSLARVARASA
jgi:glycosyltransferase involved in cell wall biosynthesis